MNIALENTARALRDETLLMKSRWCKLGFHTWEQWSKPYLPKNSTSGSIQHRYCASCNKAEAHRVDIKTLK